MEGPHAETSYPRAAVQNTGVKTFQSLTLTASFEILVDLGMGLTVQSHVLFFSVKTDVSGKHSIFNAFVADFCHHFNCKLSELSFLNITHSISKHVFLSEALVI